MARKKGKKLQQFIDLDNCFLTLEETPSNWQAYFGNKNPIVLELGAGRADFSIGMAEQNPEINYVAIDIKPDRLVAGGKLVKSKGLKNIAFVKMHIEKIDDYFPKNSIEKIWITFPDPYPKPSKANKRLMHSYFLSFYSEILKEPKDIFFKTDNLALYEFALEHFAEKKIEVLEKTDDLYNSELENDENSIKTAYELRFLAEGLTTKYIHFRIK